MKWKPSWRSANRWPKGAFWKRRWLGEGFFTSTRLKASISWRAVQRMTTGEHRIHIDYRYPVSGITGLYIALDPNNRRQFDEGNDMGKAIGHGRCDLERRWSRIWCKPPQYVDCKVSIWWACPLNSAPLLNLLVTYWTAMVILIESIAINATAITLNFV